MAIILRDATSPTPVESPLTVSDTVLEIVPHKHTVSMTLRPLGADVRYGDNDTLDGTAGNGYAVVANGASADIWVKNGSSIFVVRDDATDVELGFHFTAFQG